MSSSARLMPVMTSGKTMFDIDGMMTATRLTLWLASAPAILLGTYPNRLATRSTFSRVVSDTSPRFRRTRLTVISETPDASETSRRVRGRLSSIFTESQLVGCDWKMLHQSSAKAQDADIFLSAVLLKAAVVRWAN